MAAVLPPPALVAMRRLLLPLDPDLRGAASSREERPHQVWLPAAEMKIAAAGVEAFHPTCWIQGGCLSCCSIPGRQPALMKYPAVAASPQMSPVCPQQGGYPAAPVGFRQRGCIARPLQGDADLRDWEEVLL